MRIVNLSKSYCLAALRKYSFGLDIFWIFEEEIICIEIGCIIYKEIGNTLNDEVLQFEKVMRDLEEDECDFAFYCRSKKGVCSRVVLKFKESIKLIALNNF